MSQPTLSAAEANRDFYAEHALTYDATEECVVDQRLRRRARATLEHVVAGLRPNPSVLDACGGSGNVSLMLLELGVAPVTADISSEMLAIYERKARALGWEPDTRLSEIDDFLERGDRSWDLIVFSSALHHLEHYHETLKLAARRLSPGGLILTMFDPTVTGALGRALRRFDYLLHVLARTPGLLPRMIAHKLGVGGGGAPPQVGMCAERHALHGVDDLALRRTFEATGLRVLSHQRRCEGRFRLTRLAFKLLRQPSAFDFIVQAPDGSHQGPTGPEHGQAA